MIFLFQLWLTLEVWGLDHTAGHYIKCHEQAGETHQRRSEWLSHTLWTDSLQLTSLSVFHAHGKIASLKLFLTGFWSMELPFIFLFLINSSAACFDFSFLISPFSNLIFEDENPLRFSSWPFVLLLLNCSLGKLAQSKRLTRIHEILSQISPCLFIYFNWVFQHHSS